VVPLEIEVSLDPACSIQRGIYIPNIFSPNGDHINDVFTISMGPDIEIESMDGSIYDKWGNLVFKSKSVPFVWDGQFEEERMVPDVFAYAVKVKYRLDGEEHSEVFSGDVTLIR
jgi:gliding motility-associated-like protein